VLTGSEGDEPDLMVREARPGDRFLLCSDGLSGFVARDTIADVLSEGQPVGPTADRLVELALKAGAPDNVTVVVADVVDLDSGSAPSTVPQVVGAAAQRRRQATRAVPQTPAAKAAALSREATGVKDDDEVTLAEETRPSGPARWLRRAAVAVLALVVLAGGVYAGWYWVQRQFYVGVDQGRVAIFRGVSQDLGPIRLSQVEQVSTIAATDLPDFYRAQVQNTITTSSLDDAEQRVDRLREEAVRCVSRKAAGGTCGAAGSVSSPTTSPTPTSTTTSSPTPTSPTGTASPSSTVTTAP
jgi:protein phosphatase